ncbi:hypothetical protein JCM6882_006817 [Rhodosporidiobolus microsporus]
MQAADLRDLKVDPRLRAKLLQAQYTTASEVLLSPPAVVARRAKLSLVEASQIVAEVAVAASSGDGAKDSTVAALAARPVPAGSTITMGDPALDELLGGGLRTGSVTEVAGQSSSGKSHLCLQTSLTCQLPPSLGGLSGGALLISSEGTVPSSRLLQLAENLVASLPVEEGTTPLTTWDLLDNVHTEKAPDVETLEALLSYHAPAAIERINTLAAAGTIPPSALSPSHDPLPSQFLSHHRRSPPRPPLPIRLVIVDSIAAPFRAETETGSSGFAVRAKDFAHLGDTLKRLAHVFGCAVLVVNQVTDVFDSRGAMPPSFFDASDASPQPGAPFQAAQPFAAPAPLLAAPSLPVPPQLAPLSRSNTSSSTQSGSSAAAPVPPHRQYNFPPLLYSRFQSPHFSGASASSPSHVSSTSILPFSPTAPVSAALGHTWSTIPTVRVLCLLRRSGAGAPGGKTRRAMSVVFSPFASRAAVEYEITEDEGVKGVGPVVVRPVERSPVEGTEEDD